MKNIKNYLEIAYEANENLAMWGVAGLGKTAYINQFAKDKSAFLQTLILSCIPSEVLGGLPGKAQEESGAFVSVFAKPIWLKELEEAAANGQRCILFLDEFNRADVYAQNAAMTLVLDRKINGHYLPQDTFIVCALNPPSDDDMGVQELTDPMVDRFCHVPIHSDTDEWLAWGKGAGLNKAVLNFYRQNKNVLNQLDAAFDFDKVIGNRIKSTNRTGEFISKICNAADNLGLAYTHTAVQQMLCGRIGEELTGAFLATLKDDHEKLFTPQEVLEGNEETLERVKELIDNDKTQILIASLENAYDEIPKLVANATELLSKPLQNFILACPEDIQVAFWQLNGDEDTTEKEFWMDYALQSQDDYNFEDAF